jgi:hypothetical protein
MQKDETNCLLYGGEYRDLSCTNTMESECVSFAIRNLAVSKFGSWSDAEYTPAFLDCRYTGTNNVEHNLLSALNIATTEGIPSAIQ